MTENDFKIASFIKKWFFVLPFPFLGFARNFKLYDAFFPSDPYVQKPRIFPTRSTEAMFIDFRNINAHRETTVSGKAR